MCAKISRRCEIVATVYEINYYSICYLELGCPSALRR